MRIDNQELLKQLKEWSDAGENAKIVSTARFLPKKMLNDETLTVIIDAYIEEADYKNALILLESQRERLDGDYHWHFRMGMALYYIAVSEEYDDNEKERLSVLERSQIAFARCMNLNPPENVLNEAGNFLDRINAEYSDLDEDEYGDDCEMYDDEELDAIEEHIEEYFGDFPTIYDELKSDDIHCDIYIVPPTETRDYYTLITVGMGAHIMDIPEDLDAEEQGRAELLMCLPKSWKIGESTPEWFWPISLLKSLARLPINCESWLGWGHSVDNKDAFADNTKLCGSLLIYPEDTESGADTCKLPNGDTVNFYEVIPLYREEMDFKIDNDAHELLEKMNGVSHILDVNRPNVCDGYEKRGMIDAGYKHYDKITEKGLPLDIINGCNHIAIFLRWCIEHDLHNRYFFNTYPGVVENVKNGKETDLRKFLVHCTQTEFNTRFLNYFGFMFARRYYDYHNHCDDCFFPADVDKCAEDYFGTEKYNCEEFQDEAYLFVPFDEEYYKRLSAYIDRAYNIFYTEYLDYFYNETLPLIKTAENIFGRENIFPKDQREITKRSRLAVTVYENQEKTALPVILYEVNEERQNYAKELSQALYDCVEPFWLPALITFVSPDFAEKFSKSDTVVLSSDEIKENAQGAKDYFGTRPAVLVISEDGNDLMLPIKDDEYMLVKGV